MEQKQRRKQEFFSAFYGPRQFANDAISRPNPLTGSFTLAILSAYQI